jgi:hypothetical protein
MRNEPDPAGSNLTETMAARIEITEAGDPAHQKKITDAIEALEGVIETKIIKDAAYVSYDPLAMKRKSRKPFARPEARSRLQPRTPKPRIQICQRRRDYC